MRKETPENTDVQDKLRCFWNKTHTHIHTQPENLKSSKRKAMSNL